MLPTLLYVYVALTTLFLTQQHVIATQNEAKWPSLLFRFKVKRTSMDIYGQRDFIVYANPNVMMDESSVLYDVFATFKEGSAVYNYTRVNGVAYLQTTEENLVSTRCLESEMDDFPPINAMISAINDAKPVASVRDSIKCDSDSDSLYKVSVDESDFTLCVSGNSSFQLFGSDMDIIVDFLQDPVKIVSPNKDKSCEVGVSPSSVTATGKSILTGAPLPAGAVRGLEEEFSLFGSDDDSDDDDSCSCKSTPRPCIFIHGLGVKNEVPNLEESLPYWGDKIASHAPCCTSVQFAHLNTVNYTWLNTTQQNQVCDHALEVSNTSTKLVIKDTIVVTHSMGSLMLAGAMARGRCKLDSSSTWISTAAPMIGSMAADYAQEVCAGDTNFIAEKLAEFKDQCPVNKATKSLAYSGGDYSTSKLNAAYKVVQKIYRANVFAVMCSESFSGILSSYQASFWVLGEMIPHKSKKNDGTVEYHSCSMGLDQSKFGETYKSRFYRTKLNHYDMQFRAGDAFWNKAKMPVKWFECLL
ncbi:hypothetical protein P3T76_015399 [Phytophthora citrophthora]|uniref:GPI inositol-deacylase n=1 Tax=Phytophthora citrophthora TaxID=4793 RepID=A0AAD9LAB6_9STRA|nr:hypothetical protein P3T76_015399 [Phytophthora citrophthora]